MVIKCFQLAPESTIDSSPVHDSLNGTKSLTGHPSAFTLCEGKRDANFPVGNVFFQVGKAIRHGVVSRLMP